MIDAYDENNRFGLLTIRAQQNEVDVFEDTLKLILPILFTYPAFIYTIEDDNTPNRHIHIFLQNCSKAKSLDASKLFQKFDKVKTKLRAYIKLKQTQEKPFWDERLIPNTPEKFFEKIGYIQKDILVSRRRVKNITSEVLTQGVNFYASTLKIDSSCTKNDWTAIKPQNAHSLIEHYCSTENVDVNDTLLIPKMVQCKHTFNQITPQQLKLSLSELKYQKDQTDHKSLDDLTTHQNGGKIDVADVQQLKGRIEDLEDYNKRLIEILTKHDLDYEVPQWLIDAHQT